MQHVSEKLDVQATGRVFVRARIVQLSVDVVCQIVVHHALRAASLAAFVKTRFPSKDSAPLCSDGPHCVVCTVWCLQYSTA